MGGDVSQSGGKGRLLYRAGAFTLVEVALALGIISAAIIPLLGLMSVGFASMRETTADVRSSIIAQKVLASAQMVPFAELDGKTWLLDSEGREVNSPQEIFTATLMVEKSPAGDVIDSANLARVSVTIEGAGVQGRKRVYSTTVARLGD